MNVWDYLDKNSPKENITQYKKWLDTTSSHFFSVYIDHQILAFAQQKRIAKKAIEEYNESGNHLIYFSYGYIVDDKPLLIIPIQPKISHKNKQIEWSFQHQTIRVNETIFPELIEIEFEGIDDWILAQNIIPKSSISQQNPSLYFNLHSKKYIQNDLLHLKSLKETSQAIDSMFHDDTRANLQLVEYQYLDFLHLNPIDYSQSKAISYSIYQPIVISGPPGTGKSQTILNLALEEIKSGKKVAILSQKKVAMEVILQRLIKLNLENIFHTTIDQNVKTQGSIESIEVALEELMESRQYEEYPFNLVYYQHCIRTLEDYYRANELTMDKSNSVNSELEHLELFQWISPNQNLIKTEINEISSQLNSLRLSILELVVDFSDFKFKLFQELKQILPLIEKIESKDYKEFVKNKSKRKQIYQIEKQIQSHQSKKPVIQSNLYQMSSDKLEFLINYLKQNQSIFSIFNSKYKLANQEVKSLYNNWTNLDIWSKIEELNRSLLYKNWYEESLVLEAKKLDFWAQFPTLAQIQIYEYVEDKLKADLPLWKFSFHHFVEKKLDKKNWNYILHQVKSLIDLDPNFAQIPIQDFISKYEFKSYDLCKKDWEYLCTSQSKIKTQSKSNYPILKNYNFREIAQMAIYIRHYSDEFRRYQLNEFKSSFHQKKSEELKQILNKRGHERKSQWKRNIAFIQKNWSQKRKKLSLFQYNAELDFDFLSWLKPLHISTIDQFSQYNPFQKEIFDTIIIDESSQVEVIDVIPALYRARKVIIVGDSQQLTPTRYFRLNTSDILNSHESILELAEEKLPKIMLQYHYRSQFSNLIQFSNQIFYQSQLKHTSKSSPISVNWKYSPDGIYHNRTNIIEAKNLINHLINISLDKSLWNLSYGIICFSIQQKEAIEDELDTAIQLNQSLAQLIQIQQDKHESFFVKSIENVQGDERDVILISSGYARNDEGKFYQYFGPILSYRGENRLNVLMSRARNQIVFFSSIKSSDIHIKNGSSNGLQIFKKLFEYLENQDKIQPKLIRPNQNYWEYFLNPFRN